MTAENGPVKKLVFAALYIFAATSVSSAQTAGFNPGTVVSNVYESLAAYGCEPGFGFSPPGCNYYAYAPGYRYDHKRYAQSRRFRNGSSARTSTGVLR
jgi:hypothetical protein